MNIAYKLTTCNLQSVIAIRNQIQYSIGEWIKPEFGKIFVFDTEYNARMFGNFNHRLFKCEVENPVKIEKICAYDFDRDYKKFWRTNLVDHYGYPPTGSYVCNAIRLIEEL